MVAALTTHLLSAQIDISGQLNDGEPFCFSLKRELGSTKALSDSMDEAWDEFAETQVSGVTALESDNSTTTYRYPIDGHSEEAVNEGMRALKRCAPFVVVFNRQFHRIIIKSPEGITNYKVTERTPLPTAGLQKITVEVEDLGSFITRSYLLAEEGQTAIAIPVEWTDNKLSCLPLEDIPRLFLGFPLVGTESFSFPAVINSFNFTPTENRDGVYLGQSKDSANQGNQSVVEQACALHIKLLDYVANVRAMNIWRLAVVPTITEQTWLNEEWLRERLHQFVSSIRKTPAVLNGQASRSPAESLLPLPRLKLSVEILWDLLSKVTSFRQRLPRRDEAIGWHDAVDSWAIVARRNVTDFDEAWDGKKLVTYLEKELSHPDSENATLESLQIALYHNANAIEWLNQLYKYLMEDGLEHLIRENRIIPDQNGSFDMLLNLHRDDDVAEELKHIGDDILHLGIRSRIRDSRLIFHALQVGKGDHGDREVVQSIMDRLQQLCTADSLGDDFAEASCQLLAWLVAKRHWHDAAGFPAFSTNPSLGTRRVLRIGQKGGGEKEPPLAPIKAWAENLQEYADLFPWQHILAEDFYHAIPTFEVWQEINDRGYVNTDVIVSTEGTQTVFLPDEPLPDGEHRSVDSVPTTDVFLLTRDRIGVMARVRDSQTRARLFWRFLTEWLTSRDPEGLEIQTATCECLKDHRYYQAKWLVLIVKNRWVPQGKDIRDEATAPSIAKLLRDSGWTPDSLNDDSTTNQLLKAIRVTRFDLMRHFVVEDENARSALDHTMTNILVSTGGDLRHVRAFVEDMKTDSDLPQHLAERRERRRIVKKNQRLGSLIEGLVKEGLENEGFTVKRTGIGSDFEIRYDLIQENKEIGIELSIDDRTWLVEVKATREQRVRMTAKQADNAVRRGSEFLLCVVPVGPGEVNADREEVRANTRFVENIGSLIEPLYKNLDAFNELRDIATKHGDSDIQLEIQSGTARIRIDDGVWSDGICLRDLAAHLK